MSVQKSQEVRHKTQPVNSAPPAYDNSFFTVDDADEDAIAPFPIDCLPPALYNMTASIAASVLVPIDLSAPAVLGAVSAAPGKGIRVKSGADSYLWGNLFFLSMAESGTGKSLVVKLTSAPLIALQADRLSYWGEITYPELIAEQRILNKEIARLEQQIAKGVGDDAECRRKLKEDLKNKIQKVVEIADQLHAPRLIVEDETQEHLALMLKQNNEQLFSASADAGKVIQNLVGRYSKDQSPDDAIYVKSYSGDSHHVGRMKGEPISLNEPCMALLWFTQPEKCVRLLENSSLSDGGFLPRCLMSDTKAEPTAWDDDGTPIPADVRQQFNDLIRDLHQTYWQASKVFTIPESPEAVEVIRAFRNKLVVQRRTSLRDINIFVARWHEQAWRLAVVLHLGKRGKVAHLHPIDQETAKNAVRLAEWFGQEQIRVLSVMRTFKDQDRLERLLMILTKQYNGAATLRDLQRRNNWHSEEIRRLAQAPGSPIIIEFIKSGDPQKPGRRTEIVKFTQTSY